MKLHIGGTQAKEGWKILNSQPGLNVDYIGDIRDLSSFDNECCEEIYGAHVLEHVGQQHMIDTLKGIRRLLKPDGKLMISVPDLDVLCKLFIHPDLNGSQRFHVMRMMFGGQVDHWDYHYIGFNFQILSSYLLESGFKTVERVEDFALFNDTSVYRPYGIAISLNVIAR
jgi:predicted SAM-dependent methyltransferase